MEMDALLDAADRPAKAKAMDNQRRTVDTITAAGLQPDHHILELEPGQGWFTAILLRLLGSEGSLVVQQPASLNPFFGHEAEKRVLKAGLQNARYSDAPFTHLDAQGGSIDRALWMQGPHELWFEPQPGVTFGDPSAVFSDVRRVLKPGGLFFVIDNIALPGTDLKTAGNLHRSEPRALAALIEKAGLKLERAELDWIDSLVDLKNVPTYTPGVHLNTSQFLQIYRRA